MLKLRTICLRRAVWSVKSTTSETFISSTNLPRQPHLNSAVGTKSIYRPHIRLNSLEETFGIQGPEAYAYTSRSGCLDVQDIDDVKDFSETLVSIAVLTHAYPYLTF